MGFLNGTARRTGNEILEAKEGDRVKIHFIDTLEDGTIFGSTNEDEPFEFTIGEKKSCQVLKTQ